VDEAALHNYALRYLGRYAAPRARLRQILLRRATKLAQATGRVPPDLRDLADAVVARVEEAGLLDEKAYAEAKARRLNARGRSMSHIRSALAAKGVRAEETEAALAALADEHPRPDLAAAVAYARRRRLGPWRPWGERARWQDKDLARLARAGFAYGLARRIVDAESVEALEADLDAPAELD
jgi:regulatory protein